MFLFLQGLRSIIMWGFTEPSYNYDSSMTFVWLTSNPSQRKGIEVVCTVAGSPGLCVPMHITCLPLRQQGWLFMYVALEAIIALGT